jgi:hypothetical protein
MTRKTPQQKKTEQYKKERRTGSSHGYVKSYPVTKARINRAYRHEANVILKSAGIESLEQAVEVTDEQSLTLGRIRHSIKRAPGADYKADPHSLEEWVKDRLDRRVQFAGVRYFAHPYDSQVHRKRFKKYLQSLLAGRSATSPRVASFYKAVLHPQDVETANYHASRRDWLRSFFRDEPDYEHKLATWINEMEDRHSV